MSHSAVGVIKKNYDSTFWDITLPGVLDEYDLSTNQETFSANVPVYHTQSCSIHPQGGYVEKVRRQNWSLSMRYQNHKSKYRPSFALDVRRY